MKKNELRLNLTLRALIEEYIKNNEPVSSRVLFENYLKDVSPATLRIDLFKLESQNLIYQPHTSAGRIPTIQGYREYLEIIKPELETDHYGKTEFLREILIKNYKDTPVALHYIMQVLAQDSDQLSFVAEPEISNGVLARLNVFPIAGQKLLFLVSLDSGLDKTVLLKGNYEINEAQLKKLVRYFNDELAGLRVYDISQQLLEDTEDNIGSANRLVNQFLNELRHAFQEISSYFIHFDGNLSFLEQKEFDNKANILNILNLMQRQDILLNLMQRHDNGEPYQVLLGEELGDPRWTEYALIYAKYEIFDIPGYLGVLAPNRNQYYKNILMVRDIASTITNTTKKGMMVPNYVKI